MTRGLGDPLRPDPITPSPTRPDAPRERSRRGSLGCALLAVVVMSIAAAVVGATGRKQQRHPR